jgi:hypothetical protein
VVGTTQTIDDILDGDSFDTDARFAEYQLDLSQVDYTDTKFWEVADASIQARSAAASFALAVGSTGIAVSGAGALALNVIGSDTKAYVEDSDLDNIGGILDIDARDSTSISAITGALSAAVGLGSTGVGVSIGAAVAIGEPAFLLHTGFVKSRAGSARPDTHERTE